MALKVLGSISLVDSVQVRALFLKVRKELNANLAALEKRINDELDALDVDQIQSIKSELAALVNKTKVFDTELSSLGQRVAELERTAANVEFTVGEIRDKYIGA